MSYLPTMLEQNSLDTICHEHLEYYSLAVLEFILRAAGMKVFDAELNDINGGSIRCYATHVDNARYDTAAAQACLQRDAGGGVRSCRSTPTSPISLSRSASRRSAASSNRCSARSSPKARRSTSTAPRPRATCCCNGAASTRPWSIARPTAIRTSTARARSAPIFRSSPRRNRAPGSRTTTWCCRGTFRTSSCAVSARRSWPGTKMIFPLPEVSVVGSADLLVSARQ